MATKMAAINQHITISKNKATVSWIMLGFLPVESVDTSMPGTSAQPPPYEEQPGCSPPNYAGTVTISDLTTGSSNPIVSNAEIPKYKK